jgi:hypothetical protein
MVAAAVGVFMACAWVGLLWWLVRNPRTVAASEQVKAGFAAANSAPADMFEAPSQEWEEGVVNTENERLKALLRHPVVASVVELVDEAERQFRRAEAAHDLKDEANRRWVAAVTGDLKTAAQEGRQGGFQEGWRAALLELKSRLPEEGGEDWRDVTGVLFYALIVTNIQQMLEDGAEK